MKAIKAEYNGDDSPMTPAIEILDTMVALKAPPSEEALRRIARRALAVSVSAATAVGTLEALGDDEEIDRGQLVSSFDSVGANAVQLLGLLGLSQEEIERVGSRMLHDILKAGGAS